MPRTYLKSNRDVSPETSLSLLQRVRTEDQIAWKQLADLYAPLIYSWCRRAELHPTTRQMQEVFRSVHRAVGGCHRDQAGQSFQQNPRPVPSESKVVHGACRDTNMQLRDLPESEPPDSCVISPVMDLRLTRCLDYVESNFVNTRGRRFG